MYKLSNFSTVVARERDSIFFSHTTARCFRLSKALSSIVQSGNGHLLPTEQREELIESMILVPADYNERDSWLKKISSSCENRETFHIVVLPTATCQLSCLYCGQIHSEQHMSDARQEELVKWVSTELLPRHTILKVDWFGAEPLLAANRLLSLSSLFIQLCKTRGIDYRAKVTTNGILFTPTVARKMKLVSVESCEVTLDGPQRIHDFLRPRKDRGGSYAQIVKNLTDLAHMQEPKPEITIRVNVSKANGLFMKELLQDLFERGLQFAFPLYFTPIHNWSNDVSDLALSSGSALESAILRATQQALNLGFTLSLLPSPKLGPCSGILTDYWVVDPVGTLFRCSEIPLTCLADKSKGFSWGNIGETKNRKGEAWAKWLDRLIQRQLPCWSCRFLPLCGGSCPKAWERGDVPCPPTKALLPELLRLHVEREERNGITRPSKRRSTSPRKVDTID
jgi:uncharacterized protein